MRHGFTLIELSIVLVIIGLLAGGIMVGQSMLKASEFRSVMTDTSRAIGAITAFQDKYNGLPGDIRNATTYWGVDPGGCPTNTNRVPKTPTCDGNGDGWVTIDEGFRGWQQLANAGLIGGTYSGVVGSGSVGDNDPGINAPKLQFGTDSGISLRSVGNVTPTTSYMFPGFYGLTISAGYCGAWDCISPLFTPEEMSLIDEKLDDGKPGLGKIVTRVGTVVAGGLPNCNTATTDSYANANAGEYKFSVTTAACGFYWRSIIN